MSPAITEDDWKIFRHLQALALERFCERILSEVNRLIGNTKKGSHERYLAIYKMIQRRDREIADAFNDLRRSTAIRQLAAIQSHELLTEDELARFTRETRAKVQVLLEIHSD